MTTPIFELDDPHLYVENPPHAVWDDLRSRSQLHFTERATGPGFYSVVDFESTKTVLRDVETFSSEWGMTLDTAVGQRDPAAGLMIELTDKPKHARLRKLVTAAITPQFVTAMEPEIRAIARSVVAQALANGDDIDAVESLSGPMPRRTIGRVLGIPESEQALVTGLATQAITGVATGDLVVRPHADRRRVSEEANTDLMTYFLDVTEGRPESLTPDGLVRRLMEVELDGSRLNPAELALNCLNLAIGGFETTKTVVSAGLARLAEDRDRWASLRASPELVRPMIDELFRFETPALHLMRTATAPVRLHGTDLLPGDLVAVWLAAANRDPSMFEEPHEFRIDRHPNRHITFTIGPHVCLGAQLARMEITALFEELLRSVDTLTVRTPMVRRPSNFIPGAESLGLRITRREVPL